MREKIKESNISFFVPSLRFPYLENIKSVCLAGCNRQPRVGFFLRVFKMVLISGGWMPIVYSLSDEEKTFFSLGSLSHYMGFAWHLLHQALNPTKVPGIPSSLPFILHCRGGGALL